MLTTLNKLDNVIASFNDSLGGYRPLQLCVNRLIDCDSCIDQRDLCSNVCGTLARACYSPFHDRIQSQLIRLQNTFLDVIDFMPQLLERLNGSKSVIN